MIRGFFSISVMSSNDARQLQSFPATFLARKKSLKSSHAYFERVLGREIIFSHCTGLERRGNKILLIQHYKNGN